MSLPRCWACGQACDRMLQVSWSNTRRAARSLLSRSGTRYSRVKQVSIVGKCSYKQQLLLLVVHYSFLDSKYSMLLAATFVSSYIKSVSAWVGGSSLRKQK